MSVVWRQRRGINWTEASYAVPCLICNAEIGKKCSTAHTHRFRAEMAKAFGFSVQTAKTTKKRVRKQPLPEMLRLMEAE